MIKKLALILFMLLPLTAAAGCSAMLEDEYISVTDYEEDSEATDIGDGISSYSALLRALSVLVDEHVESDKIILNNYGDIEDISIDLARASAEIQKTTPMGTYAVEYISYPPPTRIVSYYEVEINIVYKRTKEQVDRIVRSASTTGIRQAIASSMDEGALELVINPLSGAVDEDTFSAYVRDVYAEKLLDFPRLPEIQVKAYPETGFSRIFEIGFDYGLAPELLAQTREDMQNAAQALLEGSGAPELEGASAAYALFLALYESCEYEEQASVEFGSFAYGALCEKKADSAGLSLAFKALCDKLGIACMTVRGTADLREHFWNIIELGGEFFHIDVSAAWESGDESFLRGDEYMRERYVWSAEDYPACASDFYIEPPTETPRTPESEYPQTPQEEPTEPPEEEPPETDDPEEEEPL